MLHKPMVPQPSSRSSLVVSRKPRWLVTAISSNRYVLAVCLFLAIVIPELIHPYVMHLGRWFEADHTEFKVSIVGAAISLISCHLSLQRIGNLPLVSAKTLVMPTFIATYSITIVALYAFRIALTPYNFWTSFLLGIAFYIGLNALRARIIKPVIALVGISEEISGDLPRNIKWVALKSPVLDRDVSAIVIDPHAKLTLEWSRFITDAVLAGIPVYHRSHIEEGLAGKVRFSSHAENDFGALLPSLLYVRVKRAIDVIMVVLTAVPVLLILLLAAIAIKLDSPGPALFKQVRMGYRGRSFFCYKLRTMDKDASGPAFTVDADPRITKVGRHLRKWRIDELPQVINVVRGEMSWVGPRPEALSLAKKYAENVAFYDYRHAVRPGITGWAAVHQGNTSDVDAARDKLEYDFYYIRYFSFWLDCLIALKSVQTVLTGFGSR
jgi:lipopolysaccharide/colanic/teichoic acid biosynthesis glycosyltransferase